MSDKKGVEHRPVWGSRPKSRKGKGIKQVSGGKERRNDQGHCGNLKGHVRSKVSGGEVKWESSLGVTSRQQTKTT